MLYRRAVRAPHVVATAFSLLVGCTLGAPPPTASPVPAPAPPAASPLSSSRLPEPSDSAPPASTPSSAIALPSMSEADAAVIAVVWVDTAERAQSVWIEGEREVARRDGIVMAGKGGLWLAKQTPSAPRLQPPCSQPTRGSDEELSLERLDRKERQVVEPPGFAREFSQSAELTHGATVEHVAGPYLFYRTHTAFRGCGDLRGTPSFGWGVWSVEAGKAVELTPPFAIPESVKRQAEEECGCTSYERLGVAYFGASSLDVLAMFSNAAPRNYQFTGVRLGSPEAARALPAVPAGVVRWHASHRETVKGVSVVAGAGLRAAFTGR